MKKLLVVFCIPILLFSQQKFSICISPLYVLLPLFQTEQKKHEPKFKNSIGMEFVLIEAGSFLMGNDQYEPNTKPLHRVRFTKPYYIGKYEVTQKQWADVMGTKVPNNRRNNHPADKISWIKAQEFIAKLNAKEQTRKYRLPTEAEWEYAARGGKTSATYSYQFSGGNEIDKYAVYKENSFDELKPVGSKQPNDIGIYDMSGSMWEWCSDWYDEKYYERSATADPTGPVRGSQRVLRGGSWKSSELQCSVYHRHKAQPDEEFAVYGFRLVMETE